MPQFGGKRGQAQESDIVQRGGEKLADLTVQKGAAEGAKYGAIGGAIGGTAGVIGQGMIEERRINEQRQFEREKIGAQMQFEQGQQREKLMGEAAIEGGKAQAKESQLRQELQAKKQENEQEREFKMASEGKVTYGESGHYEPSQMERSRRVADYNLVNAKRQNILSEISTRSEKLQNDLAEARAKEGIEREKLEQDAVKSFTKNITDLEEMERKALAGAHMGGGAGQLMPGGGGGGGSEELKAFAEQMRTARNKQAFMLASETGDTSHIVPNSREELIMTNRWKPMAARILENSPMMGELSLRKGPGWAAREVNKLAAKMTMAELADPDIAAAIARAMGGGTMGGDGSAQPSGQPPGGGAGSQPTSKPGQQSPGQRPGGISIPRGR